VVEHDVSHYGIEQCVAQKLQSLVVQGLAFLVALSRTLVGQCRFVIANVIRVETNDVAQRLSQLLVFAERQTKTLV